MQRLLVIERSTTLGHLLQRTLAAGNMGNVSTATTYEDGLWMLREAVESGEDYFAVLIGCPASPNDHFDEILDFLAGGPSIAIPVLLISHEDTTALAKWRQQRPNSGLSLWTHFGRIPSALLRVLPRGSVQVADEQAIPQRGIRILFVDDSQSVRFAYRNLLEASGYEVVVAGSLTEAREKVFATDFDLVIVDYFLPDGQGDELCADLGKDPRTQHVTKAVITGSYRESIIKRCLEYGAVECMFKNEAKELFMARVNAMSKTIEIQKSIESERQRLDGILGSVGDGVYGVDNQGVVTFINPTARKILGLSEESTVVGRSAHDTFHYAAEKGVRRHVEDCPLQQTYIEGKSLKNHEAVFWDKNGHGIPVECTVVPLSIAQRREGSVVVFRDISSRKTTDRLRWEATHDSLTNLSNKRHFDRNVASEIKRLRKTNGYAAILYINLDRFGHIQDVAGQKVADALLTEVADNVATRLRDNDVFARLEGNSFALLLGSIQLDNLFALADSFRELIHSCFYELNGRTFPITASIGVSILSSETASSEYALENARLACTAAKKKGRDQTHIEMGEGNEQLVKEVEDSWGKKFRTAIKKNRFVFLAQPIVGCHTLDKNSLGEKGGEVWRKNLKADAQPEFIFELLLRMLSSDGQHISPAVFVPLAERVNIMHEIDLWVVRRALRNLHALGKTKSPVSFTINLSNLTLQEPKSLDLIQSLIENSKVNPSRLIFEITETSAIGNLHNARKFVQTLKKIGCRFALDDFGTGFSSFAHLKHFPVDFLKIDGMFVETMNTSEVDRTMVEAINSMAHSLKLKTIAEHVDSKATLLEAMDCGIDYVQGHYLGEPQPLNKIDFQSLK